MECLVGRHRAPNRHTATPARRLRNVATFFCPLRCPCLAPQAFPNAASLLQQAPRTYLGLLQHQPTAMCSALAHGPPIARPGHAFATTQICNYANATTKAGTPPDSKLRHAPRPEWLHCALRKVQEIRDQATHGCRPTPNFLGISASAPGSPLSNFNPPAPTAPTPYTPTSLLTHTADLTRGCA
jgi:hypothetical protein